MGDSSAAPAADSPRPPLISAPTLYSHASSSSSGGADLPHTIEFPPDLTSHYYVRGPFARDTGEFQANIAVDGETIPIRVVPSPSASRRSSTVNTPRVDLVQVLQVAASPLMASPTPSPAPARGSSTSPAPSSTLQTSGSAARRQDLPHGIFYPIHSCLGCSANSRTTPSPSPSPSPRNSPSLRDPISPPALRQVPFSPAGDPHQAAASPTAVRGQPSASPSVTRQPAPGSSPADQSPFSPRAPPSPRRPHATPCQTPRQPHVTPTGARVRHAAQTRAACSDAGATSALTDPVAASGDAPQVGNARAHSCSVPSTASWLQPAAQGPPLEGTAAETVLPGMGAQAAEPPSSPAASPGPGLGASPLTSAGVDVSTTTMVHPDGSTCTVMVLHHQDMRALGKEGAGEDGDEVLVQSLSLAQDELVGGLVDEDEVGQVEEDAPAQLVARAAAVAASLTQLVEGAAGADEFSRPPSSGTSSQLSSPSSQHTPYSASGEAGMALPAGTPASHHYSTSGAPLSTTPGGGARMRNTIHANGLFHATTSWGVGLPRPDTADSASSSLLRYSVRATPGGTTVTMLRGGADAVEDDAVADIWRSAAPGAVMVPSAGQQQLTTMRQLLPSLGARVLRPGVPMGIVGNPVFSLHSRPSGGNVPSRSDSVGSHISRGYAVSLQPGGGTAVTLGRTARNTLVRTCSSIADRARQLPPLAAPFPGGGASSARLRLGSAVANAAFRPGMGKCTPRTTTNPLFRFSSMHSHAPSASERSVATPPGPAGSSRPGTSSSIGSRYEVIATEHGTMVVRGGRHARLTPMAPSSGFGRAPPLLSPPVTDPAAASIRPTTATGRPPALASGSPRAFEEVPAGSPATMWGQYITSWMESAALLPGGFESPGAVSGYPDQFTDDEWGLGHEELLGTPPGGAHANDAAEVECETRPHLALLAAAVAVAIATAPPGGRQELVDSVVAMMALCMSAQGVDRATPPEAQPDGPLWPQAALSAASGQAPRLLLVDTPDSCIPWQLVPMPSLAGGEPGSDHSVEDELVELPLAPEDQPGGGAPPGDAAAARRGPVGDLLTRFEQATTVADDQFEEMEVEVSPADADPATPLGRPLPSVMQAASPEVATSLQPASPPQGLPLPCPPPRPSLVLEIPQPPADAAEEQDGLPQLQPSTEPELPLQRQLQQGQAKGQVEERGGSDGGSSSSSLGGCDPFSMPTPGAVLVASPSMRSSLTVQPGCLQPQLSCGSASSSCSGMRSTAVDALCAAAAELGAPVYLPPPMASPLVSPLSPRSPRSPPHQQQRPHTQAKPSPRGASRIPLPPSRLQSPGMPRPRTAPEGPASASGIPTLPPAWRTPPASPSAAPARRGATALHASASRLPLRPPSPLRTAGSAPKRSLELSLGGWVDIPDGSSPHSRIPKPSTQPPNAQHPRVLDLSLLHNSPRAADGSAGKSRPDPQAAVDSLALTSGVDSPSNGSDDAVGLPTPALLLMAHSVTSSVNGGSRPATPLSVGSSRANGPADWDDLPVTPRLLLSPAGVRPSSRPHTPSSPAVLRALQAAASELAAPLICTSSLATPSRHRSAGSSAMHSTLVSPWASLPGPLRSLVPGTASAGQGSTPVTAAASGAGLGPQQQSSRSADHGRCGTRGPDCDEGPAELVRHQSRSLAAAPPPMATAATPGEADGGAGRESDGISVASTPQGGPSLGSSPAEGSCTGHHRQSGVYGLVQAIGSAMVTELTGMPNPYLDEPAALELEARQFWRGLLLRSAFAAEIGLTDPSDPRVAHADSATLQRIWADLRMQSAFSVEAHSAAEAIAAQWAEAGGVADMLWEQAVRELSGDDASLAVLAAEAQDEAVAQLMWARELDALVGVSEEAASAASTAGVQEEEGAALESLCNERRQRQLQLLLAGEGEATTAADACSGSGEAERAWSVMAAEEEHGAAEAEAAGVSVQAAGCESAEALRLAWRVWSGSRALSPTTSGSIAADTPGRLSQRPSVEIAAVPADPEGCAGGVLEADRDALAGMWRQLRLASCGGALAADAATTLRSCEGEEEALCTLAACSEQGMCTALQEEASAAAVAHAATTAQGASLELMACCRSDDLRLLAMDEADSAAVAATGGAAAQEQALEEQRQRQAQAALTHLLLSAEADEASAAATAQQAAAALDAAVHRMACQRQVQMRLAAAVEAVAAAASHQAAVAQDTAVHGLACQQLHDLLQYMQEEAVAAAAAVAAHAGQAEVQAQLQANLLQQWQVQALRELLQAAEAEEASAATTCHAAAEAQGAAVHLLALHRLQGLRDYLGEQAAAAAVAACGYTAQAEAQAQLQAELQAAHRQQQALCQLLQAAEAEEAGTTAVASCGTAALDAAMQRMACRRTMQLHLAFQEEADAAAAVHTAAEAQGAAVQLLACQLAEEVVRAWAAQQEEGRAAAAAIAGDHEAAQAQGQEVASALRTSMDQGVSADGAQQQGEGPTPGGGYGDVGAAEDSAILDEQALPSPSRAAQRASLSHLIIPEEPRPQCTPLQRPAAACANHGTSSAATTPDFTFALAMPSPPVSEPGASPLASPTSSLNTPSSARSGCASGKPRRRTHKHPRRSTTPDQAAAEQQRELLLRAESLQQEQLCRARRRTQELHIYAFAADTKLCAAVAVAASQGEEASLQELAASTNATACCTLPLSVSDKTPAEAATSAGDGMAIEPATPAGTETAGDDGGVVVEAVVAPAVACSTDGYEQAPELPVLSSHPSPSPLSQCQHEAPDPQLRQGPAAIMGIPPADKEQCSEQRDGLATEMPGAIAPTTTAALEDWLASTDADAALDAAQGNQQGGGLHEVHGPQEEHKQSAATVSDASTSSMLGRGVGTPTTEPEMERGELQHQAVMPAPATVVREEAVAALRDSLCKPPKGAAPLQQEAEEHEGQRLTTTLAASEPTPLPAVADTQQRLPAEPMLVQAEATVPHETQIPAAPEAPSSPPRLDDSPRRLAEDMPVDKRCADRCAPLRALPASGEATPEALAADPALDQPPGVASAEEQKHDVLPEQLEPLSPFPALGEVGTHDQRTGIEAAAAQQLQAAPKLAAEQQALVGERAVCMLAAGSPGAGAGEKTPPAPEDEAAGPGCSFATASPSPQPEPEQPAEADAGRSRCSARKHRSTQPAALLQTALATLVGAAMPGAAAAGDVPQAALQGVLTGTAATGSAECTVQGKNVDGMQFGEAMHRQQAAGEHVDSKDSGRRANGDEKDRLAADVAAPGTPAGNPDAVGPQAAQAQVSPDAQLVLKRQQRRNRRRVAAEVAATEARAARDACQAADAAGAAVKRLVRHALEAHEAALLESVAAEQAASAKAAAAGQATAAAAVAGLVESTSHATCLAVVRSHAAGAVEGAAVPAPSDGSPTVASGARKQQRSSHTHHKSRLLQAVDAPKPLDSHAGEDMVSELGVGPARPAADAGKAANRPRRTTAEILVLASDMVLMTEPLQPQQHSRLSVLQAQLQQQPEQEAVVQALQGSLQGLDNGGDDRTATGVVACVLQPLQVQAGTPADGHGVSVAVLHNLCKVAEEQQQQERLPATTQGPAGAGPSGAQEQPVSRAGTLLATARTALSALAAGGLVAAVSLALTRPSGMQATAPVCAAHSLATLSSAPLLTCSAAAQPLPPNITCALPAAWARRRQDGPPQRIASWQGATEARAHGALQAFSVAPADTPASAARALPYAAESSAPLPDATPWALEQAQVGGANPVAEYAVHEQQDDADHEAFQWLEVPDPRLQGLLEEMEEALLPSPRGLGLQLQRNSAQEQGGEGEDFELQQLAAMAEAAEPLQSGDVERVEPQAGSTELLLLLLPQGDMAQTQPPEPGEEAVPGVMVCNQAEQLQPTALEHLQPLAGEALAGQCGMPAPLADIGGMVAARHGPPASGQASPLEGVQAAGATATDANATATAAADGTPYLSVERSVATLVANVWAAAAAGAALLLAVAGLAARRQARRKASGIAAAARRIVRTASGRAYFPSDLLTAAKLVRYDAHRLGSPQQQPHSALDETALTAALAAQQGLRRVAAAAAGNSGEPGTPLRATQRAVPPPAGGRRALHAPMTAPARLATRLRQAATPLLQRAVGGQPRVAVEGDGTPAASDDADGDVGNEHDDDGEEDAEDQFGFMATAVAGAHALGQHHQQHHSSGGGARADATANAPDFYWLRPNRMLPKTCPPLPRGYSSGGSAVAATGGAPEAAAAGADAAQGGSPSALRFRWLRNRTVWQWDTHAMSPEARRLLPDLDEDTGQ